MVAHAKTFLLNAFKITKSLNLPIDIKSFQISINASHTTYLNLYHAN